MFSTISFTNQIAKTKAIVHVGHFRINQEERAMASREARTTFKQLRLAKAHQLEQAAAALKIVKNFRNISHNKKKKVLTSKNKKKKESIAREK